MNSQLLRPSVFVDAISLEQANELLAAWGHKMGPLKRGNQKAICHALFNNDQPVALTTASTLIAPVVGGGLRHLTRDTAIELSRLCAQRSGLCRVMLRIWREFIFPHLGYQFAVSYQDADLHTGNTYRFDGWKREGYSRSGVDTRSQRPGRRKYIWVYENSNPLTAKQN